MRHPFYMDHLDPEEQRTVRRLYIRVVIFYCWLALFAVALVSLRIVLDPRIDAVEHEGTAYMVQASQLVGPSSALAAEPSNHARCAARDLKIVMLIEAHGEAQDVRADDLREAFFTMAKARAACAAGRTDEALAIYDGIAIVPAQSVRK
jgi:hypothetical protein